MLLNVAKTALGLFIKNGGCAGLDCIYVIKKYFDIIKKSRKLKHQLVNKANIF